MDEFDTEDYDETPEIFADTETGERWYTNKFTGKKTYLDDDETGDVA